MYAFTILCMESSVAATPIPGFRLTSLAFCCSAICFSVSSFIFWQFSDPSTVYSDAIPGYRAVTVTVSVESMLMFIICASMRRR